MSTFIRMNTRLLMILALLVCGTYWEQRSTPTASAASYYTSSQGDCSPGHPEGASWLNWNGYFALSWGTTDANLYYVLFDGTKTSRAYGHDEENGVSNNAQVNLNASYEAGSWEQDGNHTASFFSGTTASYGNLFTC